MIASDGDLEEGISGEASSLAGHLRLGRLISFYDQNHISIEGDTALAFTEDVGKRYEAYGWHVQDLKEDIALDRLEQALRDAMAVEDKPSLIIVRTHIAQGSPNKQDTAGAHGSPLGEEEIKLTKEAMGWPSQEPFFVPEEALKHFRGQTIERGAELRGRVEQALRRLHRGASGAGRGVRPAGARRAAAGLGRRGPALPRLGLDDRHAQVLADRAPVGGRARCRSSSADRRTWRRPR